MTENRRCRIYRWRWSFIDHRRKEDIIRNKSGEAFSPDFIETRLKFSPYIKEAVTFGEARPYITAMINIDLGNVGNWAEEK